MITIKAVPEGTALSMKWCYLHSHSMGVSSAGFKAR